MPEGVEYLHCLTAAIDGQGFRYRVLDAEGYRPRGACPGRSRCRPQMPGAHCRPAGRRPRTANRWPPGRCRPRCGHGASPGSRPRTGRRRARPGLSARGDGPAIAPLWIGLSGPDQRLSVSIGINPDPGRSPHYWHGPVVETRRAVRPDRRPCTAAWGRAACWCGPARTGRGRLSTAPRRPGRRRWRCCRTGPSAMATAGRTTGRSWAVDLRGAHRARAAGGGVVQPPRHGKMTMRVRR